MRNRVAVPVKLRVQVEERAQLTCEYCQALRRLCGYRFHVEHIIPRSKGGSNDLSNLALACSPCNQSKFDKMFGIDPLTQEKVPLFNPRTQSWDDHFRWVNNYQIIEGLTAIGRATVEALDMNDELRLMARKLWFEGGLIP